MPPDFLLIDKPAGPTSFDVVRDVKRAFSEKRVGHLGTLDPFATGLLVIALGKMTRLLPLLQGLPKSYRAVAHLGATSTTGDPEGTITETGATIPARRTVGEALEAFRGQIWQTPPAHSAVKVAGKRAYELARAGLTPELQPRAVTIHSLTVLRLDPPELEFDVTCSTGTYIRSLAADIGKTIGCGAYLTSLRRTAIGSMKVEDASDAGVSAVKLLEGIVPMRQISAAELEDVQHGRSVRVDGAADGPLLVVQGETVVASGEVKGGVFWPGAVLVG